MATLILSIERHPRVYCGCCCCCTHIKIKPGIRKYLTISHELFYAASHAELYRASFCRPRDLLTWTITDFPTAIKQISKTRNPTVHSHRSRSGGYKRYVPSGDSTNDSFAQKFLLRLHLTESSHHHHHHHSAVSWSTGQITLV